MYSIVIPELLVQKRDLHIIGYEYLLALSSDSLCVISRSYELVETIITGRDDDALVCSADNEDDFLEAISSIKYCIFRGINPIQFLNL